MRIKYKRIYREKVKNERELYIKLKVIKKEEEADELHAKERNG